MGRRKMETGDVVVVDARGVRAFGIVEEISGDAEKTGGLGNASQGKWAYRVRILCGSRHADGSPVPADTDIWINDDPWDVRVDGEDGYALPEHFQGEDVARLLAKAGVARKSMTSDEEGGMEQAETAHGHHQVDYRGGLCGCGRAGCGCHGEASPAAGC